MANGCMATTWRDSRRMSQEPRSAAAAQLPEPAVTNLSAPRLRTQACMAMQAEDSHRAMSAQASHADSHAGIRLDPSAWRDSVQSAWPPGLLSNERHSAFESRFALKGTGSACVELSRAAAILGSAGSRGLSFAAARTQAEADSQVNAAALPAGVMTFSPESAHPNANGVRPGS